MTKYIIHGGFEKTGCSNTGEFFDEVLEPLNSGDTILFILFHHSGSSDVLLKKNLDNIKQSAQDKYIKVLVANRDDILDKLKQTDCLFMRGGSTYDLYDNMRKFPGIKEEIMKKKVVVGISAGVYVLCKYFHSLSENKVDKGFGILDMIPECHFDGDKEKALNRFKKFEDYDKYEFTPLKNCEYKIFYK